MYISFANRHGRQLEFQLAPGAKTAFVYVTSNRNEVLELELSQDHVDDLIAKLQQWRGVEEVEF